MANIGKKFINSVDQCVEECLSGLVAANDHLRLISKHRIVIRSDYERVKAGNRVTVVAGGGSGHEPCFAGFVGEGMLTAAIAGSVFASPPASNILAALRLLGTGNPAGTVMVVANYTGDRLNFGLAAEQAKAEGHKIEMVLVADDCALVSANKSAGRRGLCGIVLTMKVAGAMSERGCSISEMVATLNEVTKNIGSIGLSLSPCSIPGSGPNFTLEHDEMELGLGVHGEAGVRRLKLQPAKDAVNTMLAHMTNPNSSSCLHLQPGDRVVVLINNLGGTSNLELNILTWETILWLENCNIEVVRVFCGPVMTSLEMSGITIAIMKADDASVSYIDAETSAPGWPKTNQVTINRTLWKRTVSTIDVGVVPNMVSSKKNDEISVKLNTADSFILKTAIEMASNALIDAKELLNDLDSGCGDGDCGNTLSSGALAILDAIGSGLLDVQLPSKTMQQIADICQRSMGGASGALYGIFFTACSVPLKTETSPSAWNKALCAGTNGIAKYGGAEPGDRTMLDPLYQVIYALEKCTDKSKVLPTLAGAAEEGAEKTAGMAAKAGRASYVSADRWNRQDPGARAVAIIFRAIANSVRIGGK